PNFVAKSHRTGLGSKGNLYKTLSFWIALKLPRSCMPLAILDKRYHLARKQSGSPRIWHP
ncbi:hypothetical protein ACSFVD_006409, partial [Pseudomonas aeruginosa]